MGHLNMPDLQDKPPIVILAGRSILSYLLINWLAERYYVRQVIFEAAHTKQMLRYRVKKLGLWIVAGQLLFLIWDRIFLQRRSHPIISDLLNGYDTRSPDGRLPTIDVDKINNPQVVELIQHVSPAAIVVTGTGIIGKKLLQFELPFINIHCGITPRYRGVHGAFWAVYEGKPELAGTTIHLIDPGVDTGAIVAQAVIDVEQTDTYRTLPVKQYIAGIPLIANALDDVCNGSLKPYQRNDLESRQWYSPTLRDYWRFQGNLRKPQF
jgi:folate-dependent phosphoribosylglycinamide formyltransferase PurN